MLRADNRLLDGPSFFCGHRLGGADRDDLHTLRAVIETPAQCAESAICRRRRPTRYHWGALGVANAAHAPPAVSHTTRLAHLRGQIGVRGTPGENRTSGDTFSLS